MRIDDVSGAVVDAAMKVLSQVLLPVRYDGAELEAGYKLDLLVEDCVIAELKAVEALTPLHHAQLLSYLKMSNKTGGTSH
jgi:GxxExxY protein